VDSLTTKYKRVNEKLFKRLAAIETQRIYEQARRQKELERLRQQAIIEQLQKINPQAAEAMRKAFERNSK